MDVEKKIVSFFKIVLQEMNTNPTFEQKLATVFEEEKPKKKASSSRKRNPAAFNPESVLEREGELALRSKLESLDIAGLKDIISEYGMDPARKVMRWRTKEKILGHILEVSKNRAEKGNAFRV